MKVLPFKIPKAGNNAIVVQEDIEMQFYDKLHQHEELQISYIHRGKGTLLVGDSVHSYNQGDILVLGSYLPHVFKSEGPALHKSHMISVFFTKENFGEQLFKINELKPLHNLLDMSQSGFIIDNPKITGQQLFKKLVDSDGPKRFLHFFELLLFLDQEKKSILSSTSFNTRLKDNEGERMRKVFNHLVSHFHEQISLEDISEVASLTPTAFCRFFRLRTRKTFSQFLLELRLEHACKLLENKGSSMMVSEVAFKSGFNSVSNFNRFFKKVKGISPLNYSTLKIDGATST